MNQSTGNPEFTTIKELILGGARSGKSGLAQRRALASEMPVVFIATAVAGDEEMAVRIARHRNCRPREWMTIEEPLALAAALRDQAMPGRCIVVDCLTLWLSNVMHEGDGYRAAQTDALLEVLPDAPGHVILVSNEMGQGIVPAQPLARRFRDHAGWLHQRLAALCDRVTLTVAGLPLEIKGANR
jgi:adenosylcobinamide kinase/adenosylcobinamide-phosphate guanylyltransferase